MEEVRGSNPRWRILSRTCRSAVDRFLGKEEVKGSIPFLCSCPPLHAVDSSYFYFPGSLEAQSGDLLCKTYTLVRIQPQTQKDLDQSLAVVVDIFCLIFPFTCCQSSVSSDFASEQGTEDALLAVLGIFARVAQW